MTEEGKKHKVSTSIYITPEVRHQLDALAADQNRTRSNMLSVMIQKEYEEMQMRKTRQASK